MSQVRATAEREQEILDPPEFWSLADMQALRSAVVATFDDAVTWTNGPERSGQQEHGVFAWPLIRDTAQSTAAELGIPAGDMDAVVHVLNVQGSWCHHAGPGCGICSVMMPDDPQAARLLLHDLFRVGAKVTPQRLSLMCGGQRRFSRPDDRSAAHARKPASPSSGTVDGWV